MTDPGTRFQEFAVAALPHYLPEPELAGAGLSLLNVSENGTFRLEASPPSTLRVHRSGYHSEQAIRSELAWIEALRTAGAVRTPAFLPALDGSDVVRVQLPDGRSRHVVRFAWVDGAEPDESRLVGDFEQLGAIAARLHAHVRTWRRPTGFTRFTWDYEHSLGKRGLWGDWRDGLGVGAAERAILTRLDDALQAALARFGQGPERFGLIHADMRLANLLVAGDEVTVIDFDDCGFGWYMYDFAAAVSFIEHEPYIPELADAWVRGYREVARLGDAEVAALPMLVMLRRLLLVAWIGSHSDVDTARALGAGYTRDSCDLADRYLSGTLFG